MSRNIKITFSSQEEKDAAVAEAVAAQAASTEKHANWVATVEGAEVVAE